MSEKRLCPVCSEGHLITREEERKTEYKGHRGVVRIKLAVCNACGVETAGQDESRANKRAVIRFRKEIEHLLIGEEIQGIRTQYGLTQIQAAKLFGGGPVAFSKYEHDDLFHSPTMDLILRLVKESEDAFSKMLELKGMKITLRHKRHDSAFRWDIGNGVFGEFDMVVGG